MRNPGKRRSLGSSSQNKDENASATQARHCKIFKIEEPDFEIVNEPEEQGSFNKPVIVFYAIKGQVTTPIGTFELDLTDPTKLPNFFQKNRELIMKLALRFVAKHFGLTLSVDEVSNN